MTRREFLKWSIRAAAASTFADACVLEPRWIEWTNVPLVPRGNATTTVEFIQISDLHLKFLNGVLIAAADKINAIKPDLIFLTGDSVDRPKDLPVLEEFLDIFYLAIPNHCPEYRDHFAQNVVPLPKIDAVLSGHTHGGQINLFGFIPLLPPESGMYVKGWYAASDPPIYVSRGIGYSGVPARFGSRPEITTFKVNV